MESLRCAVLAEDYLPRNEAFWFRGGILPDKAMIKKREGTLKLQKKHRYVASRFGYGRSWIKFKYS
jgi:hypothetical protein